MSLTFSFGWSQIRMIILLLETTNKQSVCQWDYRDNRRYVKLTRLSWRWYWPFSHYLHICYKRIKKSSQVYSRRSLNSNGWKWTVFKLDGLEPNWTVICTKVDGPGDTFSFLGRSLSSLKFDASNFIHLARPVFSARTVHFRRPSTLVYDRQLSVNWTVLLSPHGPSALT